VTNSLFPLLEEAPLFKDLILICSVKLKLREKKEQGFSLSTSTL
jgi:hypothetical protein